MTYLLTTSSPGDLDTYRRVCAEIEPFTTGLVARYAGPTERGLAITAIWESKADCDRFTIEHLVPALRSALGDRFAASSVSHSIGFEAEEHTIGAAR